MPKSASVVSVESSSASSGVVGITKASKKKVKKSAPNFKEVAPPPPAAVEVDEVKQKQKEASDARKKEKMEERQALQNSISERSASEAQEGGSTAESSHTCLDTTISDTEEWLQCYNQLLELTAKVGTSCNAIVEDGLEVNKFTANYYGNIGRTASMTDKLIASSKEMKKLATKTVEAFDYEEAKKGDLSSRVAGKLPKLKNAVVALKSCSVTMRTTGSSLFDALNTSSPKKKTKRTPKVDQPSTEMAVDSQQ